MISDSMIAMTMMVVIIMTVITTIVMTMTITHVSPSYKGLQVKNWPAVFQVQAKSELGS